MDAIEQLETEHRTLQALLGRLDATTDRALKTRRHLFARLRTGLMVHETMEEEILYPALKRHARARDSVLEGYEEHHVVDEIMEELAVTPFDDETWSAKFSVMRENLEHHIGEEEGQMFTTARSVLDEGELAALGAAMTDRRREDAQRAPSRVDPARVS